MLSTSAGWFRWTWLFLAAVQFAAAQQFVYPVGDPNEQPTFTLPNKNGFVISQAFMNESGHTGVDLANGQEGDIVRVIGPGTVSLVETTVQSGGWGNIVMVRHDLSDGTFYSLYAHLQEGSVAVSVGQLLQAGDTIGKVDCTGNTHGQAICQSNGGTGPHLHFGVKRIGVPGCGYITPLTCKTETDFSEYLDPLQFVANHRNLPNNLLVGTDLPPNSEAELAVIPSQFLAQQFTITSPVHITGISLQMSGFGTDQFTLWLTNSVGPGTTSSNVLLQINLTFPNTGGGVNGQTVTTDANLTLSPGTYFLVTSATQTSVLQGWLVATTILPSSVGTISSNALSSFFTLGGITNSQFPPASTFNPGNFLTVPFAFEIDGTRQ